MNFRAIVPVKLRLPQGDVFTLWAPPWRENGQQWQAFLGDDRNVLGFTSPEELLVYLETHSRHDLADHPKWAEFSERPADRVVPDRGDEYDIVAMPEALAGRASYENVTQVAGVLEIVEALASVGAAEKAQRFFASNSVLRSVNRGTDYFTGNDGKAQWSGVGRAVADNWVEATDDIDRVVRVEQVDDALVDDSATRISSATAALEKLRAETEERRKAEADNADPYDTSAWAAAGIDPIKITSGGTSVYTLRTYVDSQPVFLGRYAEIRTFPTGKQLVRWITENHDHDLAGLSTWQDLVAQAHAGELEVTVHADNAYSLTGLAEDISTSPEAVDVDQMNRAYELMADAADFADDDSLNSFLLANPRFQDYLAYMLGSREHSGYVPSRPYDDKAKAWRELENMLTERFTKF